MKQTLKSSFDMLSLLKIEHPLIGYVYAFGIISNASLPFYSLFFSSQILNALYHENNIQAKQNVLYLLIGAFLLGFVAHFCDQAIELYTMRAQSNYEQLISDKCFTIGYEKYEKRGATFIKRNRSI